MGEKSAILDYLSCSVCSEFCGSKVRGCMAGHFICFICERQVEDRQKCSMCREPVGYQPSWDRFIDLLTFSIPCRYASDGCEISSVPAGITTHYINCKFM